MIHGGPGAPGHMAPVARELSGRRGVLEPLQTAENLPGQVEELRNVLEHEATLPATLIGSSWGAMLSYLVAARHPFCCGKLILVGSAMFEERYAAGIQETRLSRLDGEERAQLERFLKEPISAADSSRESELLTKADAFDPLTLDVEVIEHQMDLHKKVWGEALEMRRSGELLELGRGIQCPVVAIHGDYDPHPAEGVRESLQRVIRDFRFVRLERCGHLPWIERQARERFYKILEEEL